MSRTSATSAVPARLRLTALVVAALSLGALVPAATQAASVSLVGNTVVRWKKNPVPYVLHPACSGDLPTTACLDEVRKSFAAWVGPTCSYLQFSDAGFSSNLKLTSVGYNENGKNEFAWIENSAWTYGKYVLGVTSPLYYTSGKDTGVIIEADIAMNGYLQTWSMSGKNYSTDVMNVAVHEIGHFFGLQHNLYPNKNKPETMAPTADPFMGSRTPEQDDLDGLCFLYPKSGAFACQSNAQCPKVVDDGPSGEIYVGQIPCQNNVCAGAPTTVPKGGGKLGDTCGSDADCDTPTFCQPLSGSSAVCSQDCNPSQSGSCPSGFGCVAYQGSTTKGACIAGAGGGGGTTGTKSVGETCSSSSECKTQLCVQSGGKTTCEVPCTANAQCPSGQTCQLFSGKSYGACAVPPSGGGTDKLPDGAGCTASSQCQSGLCVGSGSTGTCVADCSNKPCPTGNACMPLSSGKGGCFPTGDAKLGESCGKNLDCQSGMCAPADGKYICSQSCSSSAGCPSGFACYDIGGTGACLPAEQKKGVGEGCQSSSDCVTGLCVGGDSGATCSQPCTTDAQCGKGAACAPLQGGGGACFALGSKTPGQTCDSPYDCTTGECVDFGKGYVCGAPCTGAVDCACGEQCAEFGSGAKWCSAGKKVACVPDFEPCSEDGECVGGLCLGGKCAPACSIFSAGATCGEDKGCVRLQADKPEGVCSSKGPDGFGNPCSGDTACISLFCHEGSCGKPCNPFGPNTCPLGLVCAPAAGTVGACKAPTVAGEDVAGGGDAGGSSDAGGATDGGAASDSGGSMDSGGKTDSGGGGTGGTDAVTGGNGGTGGTAGGLSGGSSSSACSASPVAPPAAPFAWLVAVCALWLLRRRRAD